ncbi:MAG TPA: dephospho-CoA kinase [Anaerolineaceae bacterium]
MGTPVGKWAGKYVIGLTGNIGTGKSVVRKMLEHLGAYGIDADALAHRVIAKGGPGYQAVINTFGRWILDANGEIDRSRLGRLVFADPDALKSLEAVVHPYVLQAIDWLVQRTKQDVVVIEAIKLIETNIHKQCDALWVTTAPPEVQAARLVKTRHMSEADARQRIAAQPPQETKIRLAQVVIRNDSTFEAAWKQVTAAWKSIGKKYEEPAPEVRPTAVLATLPPGPIKVERGRPRQSKEIADLFNRLRPNHKITSEDIMAAFGEKAFLLLSSGNVLAGVVGWQVENLVARTTDILLDPRLPVATALKSLVEQMEAASRDLQCEASLVFVPAELSSDALWSSLGYQRRTSQSLGVLAWQEAAQESQPEGTVLFFKQLRVDRVLRPI